VGCSGWSYTSWQGPFYPPTIDNSAWLKYYSHIFEYVEIDSSFYRIPTIFMVKNWHKRSPQNFRFTAKFPKIITHDKRLKAVDKELGQFFEAMRPPADKTLALLIQILEGLQRLRGLVQNYSLPVRWIRWLLSLVSKVMVKNIPYFNMKKYNIIIKKGKMAEIDCECIPVTLSSKYRIITKYNMTMQ